MSVNMQSVDESVYVQLLTAIENNPRALQHLTSQTHTILMRNGTKTYFILYTIKSDFMILLVNDPQSYDVIWEDDVAEGIQAVEGALDFFRDILENHPEELTVEHLDFVMSLKLLHEAFVAPVEDKLFESDEEIEKNLLRSSAAQILEDERVVARTFPRRRRNEPLLGPRKEYIQ